MKYFKLLILCLCLFTVSILTPSCQEDPCDESCQNGSACIEGDCLCLDGTSGAECATVWRDKIVGTHSASGTCSINGAGTYDIMISKGTSTDGVDIIEISDFYYGNVVTAKMIDENSFSFISTTSSSGIKVTSASGTINGSTVTMEFMGTDGASVDNCDLTFTI